MRRLAIALVVTLVAMTCGAPPAPAAQPTETWARLGDCETGVWDKRAPNGVRPNTARWDHVKILRDGTRYEGGVHFDSRTWDRYALPEFADDAHVAHIFEQVWVAEKVLEKEGWRAWPTCSKKMGFAAPAADAMACDDPEVSCA